MIIDRTPSDRHYLPSCLVPSTPEPKAKDAAADYDPSLGGVHTVAATDSSNSNAICIV
jgi:hypothetical protein